MSFKRENLAPVVTDGDNNFYVYTTTDTEVEVLAPGYFEVDAIFDVDTIILIHTADGTDVASVVSLDPVELTTAERPIIDTPIALNNAITRAEIETGLTSVGIALPLVNSMTVYMVDLTSTTKDKTYLCRYSFPLDKWFYEKMTPVPDTVNDADATQADSLQTLVSNANKISRAEIETCITDAGFTLPIPGRYNFTLYINDIGRVNNCFLCRYDTVQDEWYQELLKKAN